LNFKGRIQLKGDLTDWLARATARDHAVRASTAPAPGSSRWHSGGHSAGVGLDAG